MKIRISCCRCDNAVYPKDETAAKFLGWWFDSRKGWLCPNCNAEFNTQIQLPFGDINKPDNPHIRPLTKDDKKELTRYFDIKSYDGETE